MNGLNGKDYLFDITTSHNQIRNLPGESELEKYQDCEENTCSWYSQNVKVRHIEAIS